VTVLMTLSGVAAAALQLYRRWWKALSAPKRQTVGAFIGRWIKVGRLSVAMEPHRVLPMRRQREVKMDRLFKNSSTVGRILQTTPDDLLAALVFEICTNRKAMRKDQQTPRMTTC
jgi:hypothetical protein